MDTVLEYFVKAYNRNTMPGPKDLTADMIMLGPGELMYEAIRLILQMLAESACTPVHWGLIILLLAHKPGRPRGDIENGYRPL